MHVPPFPSARFDRRKKTSYRREEHERPSPLKAKSASLGQSVKTKAFEAGRDDSGGRFDGGTTDGKDATGRGFRSSLAIRGPAMIRL